MNQKTVSEKIMELHKVLDTISVDDISKALKMSQHITTTTIAVDDIFISMMIELVALRDEIKKEFLLRDSKYGENIEELIEHHSLLMSLERAMRDKQESIEKLVENRMVKICKISFHEPEKTTSVERLEEGRFMYEIVYDPNAERPIEEEEINNCIYRLYGNF